MRIKTRTVAIPSRGVGRNGDTSLIAWPWARVGDKSAGIDGRERRVRASGGPDRALQAHGSLGYSTDLPLEAMYRFARAARIYDGPDEVHRASVARQVLRGYEVPADGVPTEYVPTRRQAARERFAELLAGVTAND